MTTRWLLHAVFATVVLLGVFAFMYGSGITGLSVLDTGAVFNQNMSVALDADVTSLRVSGS